MKTRVLFVCHGNICRSPMAEYLFKEMVKEKGIADQFVIASAATSTEEIWGDVGNPVHAGTRKILNSLGIDCSAKRAVQVKKSDYKNYDYLICMDSMNIRNTIRICGNDSENKIVRLLDYTSAPRDVADPWYTGKFDITYRDIMDGLEAFMNYLYLEGKIQ